MFTVKFCNFVNGEESITSISCPHYSVYKRKNGLQTVTVYKDMTKTTGIEYQIGRNPINEFSCCFVENQSGKTIATIKAD